MIPQALQDLIADADVTLLAAAILGIEALGLVLLARRRAFVLPLLANVLSGLCLILALRAALLASGAEMIALWLGLGFLAHIADLAVRLRRR